MKYPTMFTTNPPVTAIYFHNMINQRHSLEDKATPMNDELIPSTVLRRITTNPSTRRRIQYTTKYTHSTIRN